MPMSKEERREYNKQYRLKNKEKAKEYKRQWHLKNKEKENKQAREYYLKNNEKIKEYYKTEKYIKSNRIYDWKRRGILCFDYNLLYDIFLSTNRCEYCNCEFYGVGNNKKCLDHDHNITDKFNVRGVLCNACNLKDVLREEPAT